MARFIVREQRGGIRDMADTAANDKSIKELQRLAQEAPRRAQPRRKLPSRAALLESIDLLSRWSAAGLAVIAGAGIYLSITVGREYPARAAAWALMLLGALYVCRRLQLKFRAGAEISAHPFRWRASFASCLCVLGVAFASAPILLTPVDAAPILAAQAAALSLGGAFIAALFFSAHFNSAAAICVPGAIFPLLAAWRSGDGAAAIYASLAAATGIGLILVARYAVANRAALRHPRTTLLRADPAASARSHRPHHGDRQTA